MQSALGILALFGAVILLTTFGNAVQVVHLNIRSHGLAAAKTTLDRTASEVYGGAQIDDAGRTDDAYASLRWILKEEASSTKSAGDPEHDLAWLYSKLEDYMDARTDLKFAKEQDHFGYAQLGADRRNEVCLMIVFSDYVQSQDFQKIQDLITKLTPKANKAANKRWRDYKEELNNYGASKDPYIQGLLQAMKEAQPPPRFNPYPLRILVHAVVLLTSNVKPPDTNGSAKKAWQDLLAHFQASPGEPQPYIPDYKNYGTLDKEVSECAAQLHILNQQSTTITLPWVGFSLNPGSMGPACGLVTLALVLSLWVICSKMSNLCRNLKGKLADPELADAILQDCPLIDRASRIRWSLVAFELTLPTIIGFAYQIAISVSQFREDTGSLHGLGRSTAASANVNGYAVEAIGWAAIIFIWNILLKARFQTLPGRLGLAYTRVDRRDVPYFDATPHGDKQLPA